MKFQIYFNQAEGKERFGNNVFNGNDLCPNLLPKLVVMDLHMAEFVSELNWCLSKQSEGLSVDSAWYTCIK